VKLLEPWCGEVVRLVTVEYRQIPETRRGGARATTSDIRLVSPSWTDIATFSVLAAAAVVAFFQAREARRLRLAQFRPFVVLDVDRDHETDQFFLVLRNYGSTLARDIEIDVTPPLESGFHEEVGQIEKLRAWGRSVKTLAPGVERRALFELGSRYRADLPDQYEARIRYRDYDRRRHFDETVTLDISTTLRGLGRLDEVHKTIDDVYTELRRIAGALEHAVRNAIPPARGPS
jgi:hypothetical protein